jgi:hypothetical protein
MDLAYLTAFVLTFGMDVANIPHGEFGGIQDRAHGRRSQSRPQGLRFEVGLFNSGRLYRRVREPVPKHWRRNMAIRNVLAISKSTGSQYVFFFDDESREELIQTLAEFARRPDLDFEWKDASLLADQIDGCCQVETEIDWFKLAGGRRLPTLNG